MNLKNLMNELIDLITWAQKSKHEAILTSALDLIHKLAVYNYMECKDCKKTGGKK